MSVRSFQDLNVWQFAMDLAVESYRIARRRPARELYGFTSQIQRAAVSVPANIAEGHGRADKGDYLRHLTIANGSLRELETHLLLLERLACAPRRDLEGAFRLIGRVGRMLGTLMQRLRQDS